MNATTRIIAIRHGETDWNADSRLQGHTDIALNDLGRAQAACLASALGHEGLTAVVASPLQRAFETARALAGPLGLACQPEPGLRERGFGAMEGLSYQEIDEHHPHWARRWRARDPEFAPPGGETLLEFQARCLDTANRLARQHAGTCVAWVTHGGVLDCLYRAAAGVDLSAPRTWQLGNAAVNRLLFTGSGFTLIGWNDTQHLQVLARALDDT